MSETVPIVPALYTLSDPNNSSVYLWQVDWYSPAKFKSISGSLSPSNPKKTSKGISCPSLIILILHSGHSLSGISTPDCPLYSSWNSECLHFGQI